jgi:hypothetical protein
MQRVIKIYLLIIILIFIQFSALGQSSPDRKENDIPIIVANATVDIGDSRPAESIFIENCVKNLETGGLIYNPSTEMTINIGESINATIVKGNTSGEPIKVAPYMEVNLKGPGFDIVPTTESRQFIAGDSPTIWKWDVTPRKLGNQTLDLLAYVIIKMPDGHEEKRALVKSKTIKIHVNPLEKQGMFDFIPALFDGPWAKAIGALSGLLAFLVIYFKDDILAWIRSRRKLPKKP